MKMPCGVKRILSRLEEAGYQAYLVGGCVRDHFMGNGPHDFDITTDALPSEIIALFSDFRVEETGLQHGTVTVVADHLSLEITTFRTEGAYSDHRHPDQVEFTRSVEEDLARRDFTMNAIACSMEGGVVDPFGGRADIEKGLIRCVGEPALRFEEDALRILRALRFAARLGFEIDGKTKAALFCCAHLLRKIAAERILAELKGILIAQRAGEILLEYEPILKEILPDLSADCNILGKLLPKESLRFAGWLWPMGETGAKEILQKLKGSNRLQRETRLLIQGQKIAYSSAPQRVEVRKAISRFGEALYFDHLLLQRAANRMDEESYGAARSMAEKMLEEGICLNLRALAVGGEELMALGFSGAKIGAALNRLFDLVMEEKLPNEKEALLDFAKNLEK